MKVIIISAVLGTLAAPVFATTAWHPTMGEEGATYHPSHEARSIDRTVVANEARSLVRSGRIFLTINALPLPAPSATKPLERQDVVKAVIATPPEQRSLGERG